MRTIPGLPQGAERDAGTGSGTEKCRTFFCRGKEHHRENTDTLKKSPRSFPCWEASSADFLVYIAALRSNAPVTVYFPHDLSACCGGNVDLARVYRIAGRLSILIAGSWKSTGINLREFLRRLASLFGLSFLHSQCQLALENEMLRKYTILVILYKLDHKSVCQLTTKDIPELKRAAGSKPYEDENEIR